MDNEHKERIIEALRYLFENNEDIEVLDVEDDEQYSYFHWAKIKIKDWWIGPDDFDHEYVPADEDGPEYVDTHFTLEDMQYRLPKYFYTQVVNSGKVTLSRFESWSGGRSSSHIYQEFSLNKKGYQKVDICFEFSPGYDKKVYGLVTIDDECIEKYLDNPPTLEEHYTPMVVRGVMDADPEEYDFEVHGYDKIDVIIYVKVK